LAETQDGMTALRQKVQRRSRVVPPPRHPAKTEVSTEDELVVTNENEDTATGASPVLVPEAIEIAGGGGQKQTPQQPRTPVKQEKPASPSSASWLQEPIAPGANEPMANLAIRVRKSLDDRLADVVHDLRHQGLRSSKAELVELLIAALPESAEPALTKRLTQFRAQAPRP
jgi:hypothetical protein